MKIIVLDGHTLNPGDNPWDVVSALGELELFDLTPAQRIVERARDADIAVTNKVPFTKEILDQLPNLKFIAVTATGHNVIDLAETKRRGIPVSNVPEYSTDSVAQYTFGLVLELAHRIGHHDTRVHAGAWSAQPHFSFWESSQVELSGKTILIVGYGRIGKRVGEIARAFRTRILTAESKNFARLSEMAVEADVITLHCPLTDVSAGMINREFLSKMRSTAFMINTARGGLVVEQDLADALNENRIAGAAVDVVSAEPMKSDNPLLSAKNCIITPHIAWASLEARKRLMQATAENIRAFLTGKPANVVNL